MKKPNKKQQFEPIHIITIFVKYKYIFLNLFLVMFINCNRVFYPEKKAFQFKSRTNESTTKQFFTRSRRFNKKINLISFILERRRVKAAEEERKKKEDEERKLKESKEKKFEEEDICLKRNSFQNEKESKNMKIPLIDYDKYRNMESNFFSKNSFSGKNSENIREEKFNLDDEDLNNQNQNFTMKRIVLLEPENNLNKENKSSISNESFSNCKISIY